MLLARGLLGGGLLGGFGGQRLRQDPLGELPDRFQGDVDMLAGDDTGRERGPQLGQTTIAGVGIGSQGMRGTHIGGSLGGSAMQSSAQESRGHGIGPGLGHRLGAGIEVSHLTQPRRMDGLHENEPSTNIFTAVGI